MSERYDSHSAVSSGLHRDHSFHKDRYGSMPLNSQLVPNEIQPHINSLYHAVSHINSIKVGREHTCAPYAGHGRHELWTGMLFLDRKVTDQQRRPHVRNLVKKLLTIPSEVRSRICIERDELGDYELYLDGQQYKNGHKLR
jgi:hypothetical protein